MAGYAFEHGVKFLLKENEYIVRKELEEEVEIENIAYKKNETWTKTELLSEWEKGHLIFRVQEKDKEEVNNQFLRQEFEVFPEELKKEAKRRYAILEPIIKGKVNSNQINNYLESITDGVKKSAFYEWKKRWDTHQDIRFLIPRYENRGTKGWLTSKKVLDIVDEVLMSKYMKE